MKYVEIRIEICVVLLCEVKLLDRFLGKNWNVVPRVTRGNRINGRACTRVKTGNEGCIKIVYEMTRKLFTISGKVDL